MSDPTDPLAWLARAEDDYKLAKSAKRLKPPSTYGITYHAQQCAEKCLKALLVLRRHSFPKTHDLTALSDLCLQAGILVPVDDIALQKLSA